MEERDVLAQARQRLRVPDDATAEPWLSMRASIYLHGLGARGLAAVSAARCRTAA